MYDLDAIFNPDDPNAGREMGSSGSPDGSGYEWVPVDLDAIFAPEVAAGTSRVLPQDREGELRDEWEEAAAIREFDGGLPREQAEALALADVTQRMSLPPSAVDPVPTPQGENGAGTEDQCMRAERTSLEPPIKCHGGKQRYAPRIIELMPPHKHYVEPFAGGLGVLLAKDPEGVSEVVNDLNGDLMNFWDVLRDPQLFAPFVRIAEATPFSYMHPVLLSDPPHRNPAFPAVAGLKPDNLTGCMYQRHCGVKPRRCWGRGRRQIPSAGRSRSSSSAASPWLRGWTLSPRSPAPGSAEG
jgi:hypothetical protein